MRVNDPDAPGPLIGLTGGGVFPLYPDHVRHILRHAQGAKPPRRIPEFQFGRLKLPLMACRVQHILKKDIGLLHGQGHPVILNKVPGRLLIKDFRVFKAYNPLRASFVGILGKVLIAGQVHTCFRVLGKAETGHVVKQRADRFFQFGNFLAAPDRILRRHQALTEFPVFPVIVQDNAHADRQQSQ